MHKTLSLALAWLLFMEIAVLAQVNVQPPAQPAPTNQFTVGAQQNLLALGSDDIYKESLAALTMLFVLAVLLENAFTIIFNWRVFLTYFSLRGVKTIIMVLVSLMVVSVFEVDVVASLISQYKTPPTRIVSGFLSKFITSLILAGGSSGIYNIMVALGFRNPRREQEVVPEPPNGKAWVSVRVKNQKAVGPAHVKIQSLGPVSAHKDAPAPIAGVIGFRRPSIFQLLLRNSNRFPQNGGYTVLPETVYVITVEGMDATRQGVSGLGGKYVFTSGAIVDFEVIL
jgi:hypothetical protein